MQRHILIRPTGAVQGGELRSCTASDLAEIYTSEELARLAIGLQVQRDGMTHTDLLAFHDRHATPDLRGTTLLRRLLRISSFTVTVRRQVAA